MDEPRHIGGRFDVEAIAGSGGLGIVYRCRDQRTGGLAAVKVAPRASAKLRERFLREAEMLSTVEHPFVVRYIGHGLLETQEPYLAMEWLEGEDLHERLERTPLSLGDSVTLARRMAGALAAAHAVGIVHRDVKPANVFLVDKDPTQPRLIDFGIARSLAHHLTQPGGVLGTPGYMAPEQARGEAHIDARTDVFALGCVLYECVTRTKAFDGDSPMAILAKVLLEEPPPLRKLRPDAPPALEHVVARMLAKSKEARYASAQEILRDLDRLDAPAEETDLAPAVVGALTSRERKLLCLLLARRGASAPADTTLVEPGSDSLASGFSIRELSLGTGAEVLIDGSMVAVIEGSAAVDQTAKAARTALRLRELARANHVDLRLAIATGRGEMVSSRATRGEGGSLPVGEVVDRACALLELPAVEGAVRVDALTSNLVEGRFRLQSDAHGALLFEELETDGMRAPLGRRAPCIARDGELAALSALFAEVQDERAPRVVLVTGEAGIGKSRVKLELAERLRSAKPLWLSGGGDVAQPGAPFGALQGALRRELGLSADTAPEDRAPRVLARLARTMDPTAAARVAPFLAQLAGVPLDHDPDSQLEAARADAMVMGDSLRAALQDFLDAEGRERPVVLALEDMQWGDRPSMNLVLAAARGLTSTPLLVLVTGRPEVFSVFPDLVTTRVTHLELRALGPRASARLFHELAGEGRPDTLVQQASGNPFLLEELARAVLQGRGGELPETVLATAQARLEALPPTVRRVLRVGAVLGDAPSLEGMAALLDVPRDDLLERVAELVREEILEPDAAEGCYRFRQVVLREASYASLTDTDRRLAHALAAEWLGSRAGADPVTLATHYERAGKPAEASEYLIVAAEQSLGGQDFEGALARLARAQECKPTGPRLGRLWLARAETQRWLGRYADMRESAREAATHLPEGGRLWIAAKVAEAMASVQLGETRPAESLALLLAILLEGGDVSGPVVSGAARIAETFARLSLPMGRLFAALTGALGACKDEAAVGRVWNARATEALYRGDLETAFEHGEAAYTRLLGGGDVRSAAITRVNQGYALMRLGQYERATAMMRETLQVSERHGLGPSRALALHNLGYALACLELAAEGEGHEREALRIYTEQQNKRMIVGSQCYLGRILVALGRAEEAASVLRGACETAEGLPTMAGMALSGLALAKLALGDPAGALTRARSASDQARERAWRVEAPEAIQLAFAEALVANGRHTEAATVLGELTTSILEQASKLRDADLRRSFLHRVPENARAFALQASFAGTE